MGECEVLLLKAKRGPLTVFGRPGGVFPASQPSLLAEATLYLFIGSGNA